MTAPLLTDFISHWSLEASGGADDYGSLTLSANNTPAYSAGKVGNCLDITANPGSNVYLYHADSALFPVGHVPATWGFWCNPSAVGGSSQYIMSKYNLSGNKREWLIRLSSSSVFDCYLSSNGTGATQLVDAYVTPSTGNWYFVLMWHDPDADRFYLQVNDNTVNTSSSFTGGIYDGDTQFQLGESVSPNGLFDGYIDQAFVANVVWSSATRTWMYNSGNGRSWAEIVAANTFGQPAAWWM